MAVGILMAALGVDTVYGEEYRPENDPDLHLMYVICQPNDYIVVRSKPNRKSFEEGYMLPGYEFWASDKTRNGYIYSPCVYNEAGEGWVHSGYLVDDEPEDLGGQAYYVCSIGGKRRCWLYNGDTVKVWYKTEEWCVTNKGFVMTQYLEEDPT